MYLHRRRYYSRRPGENPRENSCSAHSLVEGVDVVDEGVDDVD